MPEALATTKRKFHKLLDSRFGSPQAPSPTPPAAKRDATHLSEPASKRIRSGTSVTTATTTGSLADSLHRRNGSTASVTSLRTTGSIRILNKSSAPPQPTREPPNFAPWSHDTFLARMRTFSRVTVWHPKPEAVNEVEWAKRGWSCVDTNTVCCKGGCGQRLVVKVEPVPRRRRTQEELTARKEQVEAEAGEEHAEQNWSAIESEDEEEADPEDLENALVDRYKSLIIDAHAEGCLWRQVGCKNDIYRLPVVKSTVWQPELRDRYTRLSKISATFKHVKLLPNDIKPSPERLLADFPPTLLASPDTEPTREQNNANENDDDTNGGTSPDTSTETKAKTLLVALCGWRGVLESGTELLCCDACFQRIGLWMYQPDYKRSVRSTNDNDGDDEELDPALDLIDLHREHCPWRNATTQSATGDYAGLPAWQILHNILYRYADENRRRSRDQVVGALSRATPDVEAAATVAAQEVDDSVDESLSLMPELTREETERADKERTSKLRKLKKVFGFKTKIPPAMI